MRVQVEHKRGHRQTDEGVETETEQTRSQSRSDELKAEMDELLDEIDSLLETNAEEFVKNYIQKGGE